MEAVRVLVGTTFPGVIRSGEVEGRAGSSLDLAVAVKLGTVVDGDGLKQVLMGANQLNDTTVRGADRSRAQLTEQQTAAHALDEADHAVTIRRTDDGVHPPMAGLLAQLNSGWTLAR